jgi:hypothetical protein
LIEEIILRRSVHKYIDQKPFEDSKIIDVIESARLTSSGLIHNSVISK